MRLLVTMIVVLHFYIVTSPVASIRGSEFVSDVVSSEPLPPVQFFQLNTVAIRDSQATICGMGCARAGFHKDTPLLPLANLR